MTDRLTDGEITELHRLCQTAYSGMDYDVRRLGFAAREWLPRLLDLVTPAPLPEGMETTAKQLREKAAYELSCGRHSLHEIMVKGADDLDRTAHEIQGLRDENNRLQEALRLKYGDTIQATVLAEREACALIGDQYHFNCGASIRARPAP